MLLWAETPQTERSVNPWLEDWRADSASAASDLRTLAARDVSITLGVSNKIRDVADALDAVARMRLHLGCGDELDRLARRANEAVLDLKKETIDTMPLARESLEQVRALIGEFSRRLSDLANRAETIVSNGRIEELQAEVGEIGKQLALLSFYDLSPLAERLSTSLRDVGIGLRLVEVMRLYMDGGASVNALIQRVREYDSKLREVAGSLQSQT